MKAMAGQSSVEFAVGLSTLLMLFMATLVIGTWQEAQRRVLVTARHAAFEHIWAGARDDADRVVRFHRQHLGDPGLAMPLTGSQLVGIRDLEEVPVALRLEGATGTAEGWLLQLLEPGGSGASGGFDPGGRGWAGARVVVHPREIPFITPPVRALVPELNASMLLLNDSWSASGPAQVRQRAGALVPTHALDSLQSVVGPLLLPLSWIEPSLAHFCPGLLDPDGVPEDRLSSSASPQPTWNTCR
jgi:hypothetical protein